LLNPDIKVFPNGNNVEPVRRPRMGVQLTWSFDESQSSFIVRSFDNAVELRCRPDPNQIDPETGKALGIDNLPKHRFPSTATPYHFLAPPLVRTEDDIIYRPNLPGFGEKHGHILNQRDSELLLSFLTVPYLRLPLSLSFFSTEDRVHKLLSSKL